MQEELTQEHPQLNIKILAINKIGAENGVALASENGSLPMVNDNTNDNIWVEWGGDWRDVFILDTDNQSIEIYNLTQHNLSDPVNYAELKQKLIDAATP